MLRRRRRRPGGGSRGMSGDERLVGIKAIRFCSRGMGNISRGFEKEHLRCFFDMMMQNPRRLWIRSK